MDLSLKEPSADLSPSERHCPQGQALVPQESASCPQCGFTFSVGSAVPPIQPSAGELFGTLPTLDASAPVEEAPMSDTPPEVPPATPVLPAEMPAALFAPAGMSPATAVTPPVPVSVPPKRKISLELFLIVLAVMLLLGTGGGLASLLTRPHPVISGSSDTARGSLLTSSPDAILHISGHDFTANSAIVFLLDGKAAPDAHTAQSDANGTMKADVEITDNWTFATHVLTAKDANGNITQEGVPIKVIPAPVLSVSSNYHVGTTLAASQATAFHISGKRFAPSASITLLLDGAVFLQGKFFKWLNVWSHRYSGRCSLADKRSATVPAGTVSRKEGSPCVSAQIASIKTTTPMTSASIVIGCSPCRLPCQGLLGNQHPPPRAVSPRRGSWWGWESQ